MSFIIGCSNTVLLNCETLELLLYDYNDKTNTKQFTVSYQDIASISSLLTILRETERNSKAITLNINEQLSIHLDFQNRIVWLFSGDFYCQLSRLCVESLRVQLSSFLVFYPIVFLKQTNKELLMDTQQTIPFIANPNKEAIDKAITKPPSSTLSNSETQINTSNKLNQENKTIKQNNNTDLKKFAEKEVVEFVELANMLVVTDPTKIKDQASINQLIKSLQSIFNLNNLKISENTLRFVIEDVTNIAKQLIKGDITINDSIFITFKNNEYTSKLYALAQEAKNKSDEIKYTIAAELISKFKEMLDATSFLYQTS